MKKKRFLPIQDSETIPFLYSSPKRGAVNGATLGGSYNLQHCPGPPQSQIGKCRHWERVTSYNTTELHPNPVYRQHVHPSIWRFARLHRESQHFEKHPRDMIASDLFISSHDYVFLSFCFIIRQSPYLAKVELKVMATHGQK